MIKLCTCQVRFHIKYHETIEVEDSCALCGHSLVSCTDEDVLVKKKGENAHGSTVDIIPKDKALHAYRIKRNKSLSKLNPDGIEKLIRQIEDDWDYPDHIAVVKHSLRNLSHDEFLDFVEAYDKGSIVFNENVIKWGAVVEQLVPERSKKKVKQTLNFIVKKYKQELMSCLN